MCKPCKQGKHQECIDPANCDCPRLRQDEAIDMELAAVNRQDDTYAEAILSHLQFSGSLTAKFIFEGAGRQRTRAFIVQVLTTAKALRC